MKKRTGRRHSMEIQNELKNNADDMRDVIVSVEVLPRVDFPQPDSPTRPYVSPL